MHPKTVTLLRDWQTGAPVVESPTGLLNRQTNRLYSLRHDIALLANPDDLTEGNRKLQRMYDRMGLGYDFAEQVIGRLWYGNSVDILRRELMSRLDWQHGQSVLYVSIGTGTDLRYLPEPVDPTSLHLVGLDISLGMLRKCRKNLQKWGLTADLVHGSAETLPFADNSFDVVFHNGGINFFNDKGKAIREMIRVAKPGTKLLIADETEKIVQGSYRRSPLTKGYFTGTNRLIPITAYVPDTVTNVRYETLWDDKFYCVTFRKPFD